MRAMRLAVVAALAALVIPQARSEAQSGSIYIGGLASGGISFDASRKCLAQSFTTPSNQVGWTLTQFGFDLYNTGTARGYVFATQPSADGLLATQTLFSSEPLSFDNPWGIDYHSEIDAGNTVKLAPNTVYLIAIEGITGDLVPQTLLITPGQTPYDGGLAMESAADCGTNDFTPLPGQLPGTDFISDVQLETYGTPEPSTLLLTTTGFVGLVGVIRRRRVR